MLVQMSWILTSFSWTYALLQVPAGWLAERFGLRRMLYWANLLWSVPSLPLPHHWAAPSPGLSLSGPCSASRSRRTGQVRSWQSGAGSRTASVPRAIRPRSAASTSARSLRADHYLGDPALRVALGILQLWHPRPADRHRMVVLVPRRPGGTPSHHRGGSRTYRGRSARCQISIPHDAFLRCLLASRFWAIGLQLLYKTWLPTYLVNERKLSLASMGIYASLPWRCSRPCSSPERSMTRSHVNDSEATRQ